MERNFCLMSGAIALAFMACSKDNGVGGTSTEPNTVYADERALWEPLVGDFRVNTARFALSWPKGAIEDGRWFWEMQNDAEDGGESYIEWPTKLGDDNDPLAPIVDACHGICGTAVLGKGSLTYTPFVSVGFSVAKDSAGEPLPVDVSNWGGVCVSYSSDVALSLEMDLGDSVNEVLRLGLPGFRLAATDTVVSKCIRWREFKRPVWAKIDDDYWKIDAGVTAAKQLVAMKFVIQAPVGEYKFNIKYIGTVEENPAGISGFEYSPDTWRPKSYYTLTGRTGGLWTPANDGARVPTSLYSKDAWPENVEEDGYWYWSADENVSGKSSIEWPETLGADNSLEQVVSEYFGVYGVASLKKGSLQSDPSVSFGFNIAKDSAGNPVSADVSDWNGFCVEYFSQTPLKMELVVEDSADGLPFVELPQIMLAKSVCFSWGEFNMPNDVDEVSKERKIRMEKWVESVSKKMISVRFTIQADDGDYKFGVGAISVPGRRYGEN